jgi:hypothetical protein
MRQIITPGALSLKGGSYRFEDAMGATLFYTSVSLGHETRKITQGLKLVCWLGKYKHLTAEKIVVLTKYHK